MATHDNSGYPLVLHSSADPTTLGGTAICGFSTVGSVGVIAMSHIIQTLDLDPMGTVLHPEFPAFSGQVITYSAYLAEYISLLS